MHPAALMLRRLATLCKRLHCLHILDLDEHVSRVVSVARRHVLWTRRNRNNGIHHAFECRGIPWLGERLFEVEIEVVIEPLIEEDVDRLRNDLPDQHWVNTAWG